MLATDEDKVTHSRLETWVDNERMRHVPSLAWIVEKLDVDLRTRIEKLCAPLDGLAPDHPARAAIEQELRVLCRSIDRLGEIGRHARVNGHAPNELVSRVRWAIQNTVTNLNAIDANLFGRRFPVQTHERSKAEPLYAALLVVICHVQALIPLVRVVDGGIDERLFEGLVAQPLA